MYKLLTKEDRIRLYIALSITIIWIAMLAFTAICQADEIDDMKEFAYSQDMKIATLLEKFDNADQVREYIRRSKEELNTFYKLSPAEQSARKWDRKEVIARIKNETN